MNYELRIMNYELVQDPARVISRIEDTLVGFVCFAPLRDKLIMNGISGNEKIWNTVKPWSGDLKQINK